MTERQTKFWVDETVEKMIDKVQCLPGCEAEGEPGESTGLAPGHKFAPIVARDYRRVADDKRDALDGTDTAST